MAKKSRRIRKKSRQVRLSPAQIVRPGVGEGADAPVVAIPVVPVPKVADLRKEYNYVIADLKRIAIIAVVMLAVLVVLALLLT